MENYTKYKLKSSDELASVLNGKDNLFVIACNKCFKEFETVEEPDCDEFLKFAKEQGKTVTGSAKVDFLCNKMHTERKLQDLLPEGTENVVVISCGLGIQTVADLAGKPVVAASNTLNYRGHHGMALTKKSCDACAQCYLNITGGVCPIVDCSKSLVNGQCGGAKNGKCEVDPNKDCAWEKIYQRLAKQGRLEEFLNQPVQVRDFSKVNFKVINDYVKSIREDRLDGYYGGVHPSERKEFSEHIALKKFPDPKTVVISMSQHLGAPANPIVQVGDTVKVGQKIGEAAGFISAPVHSSVSGTVVAVEPRMHGTRGSEVMAVVIESDGKNTLHESVQPHGDLDKLTPDEIIDIINTTISEIFGTCPVRLSTSPGKFSYISRRGLLVFQKFNFLGYEFFINEFNGNISFQYGITEKKRSRYSNIIERAFAQYAVNHDEELLRQRIKIFSSRVVIARQLMGTSFDWLTKGVIANYNELRNYTGYLHRDTKEFLENLYYILLRKYHLKRPYFIPRKCNEESIYNLFSNMKRNRTLLFEENIGIPKEVLLAWMLKIDASYSSRGKDYYRIVIDYLEKIKIE